MLPESLLRYMNEMLRQTPRSFKRYLYADFPWQSQLAGLVGPRGVGKSTMLRQYILDNSGSGKFLYVSADHTYFSDHTIASLADDFVVEGGTHLIVDEIHKYAGWSRELKQIYDIYPDLKVTFSGSSVLDILKGEADLSRRAVVKAMQGLSFREYLELTMAFRSPSSGLQTYCRIPLLERRISIPCHFSGIISHSATIHSTTSIISTSGCSKSWRKRLRPISLSLRE